MSDDVMNSVIRRIITFGDDAGLPQLLKTIPAKLVCGLVGAEIRPHQHDSLRKLAETHRLPLLIQPRVSSPAYPMFIEKLRRLAPELIIVNSYSMLIRSDVLAIPRFGGVNIHGALLPQYRGCNPTQWALLNNESETGVTMHYMTAEFDTGDIIAQRQVPIYLEDTWRDIQARIREATVAMLAEEIPKLLNQTNTRQTQDESKARYYKRRRPEDGLIDWQKSVLDIYNLVRALVKPHPGAFHYSGSDKVVLDEYLSIPQVTALKYSVRAGHLLKTAHVTLSPLVLADLPLLFNWIDGCQQVLINAPCKPINEDQYRAWFETIQERNDIVIFGIRSVKTDSLIGLAQLHSINWVHRSADVQIRLDDVAERDHQYGIDAVRLLLDFAFKELNLHCIYLHVSSLNKAAIGLLEKAGFILKNQLRQEPHDDNQCGNVSIITILQQKYV